MRTNKNGKAGKRSLFKRYNVINLAYLYNIFACPEMFGDVRNIDGIQMDIDEYRWNIDGIQMEYRWNTNRI